MLVCDFFVFGRTFVFSQYYRHKNANVKKQCQLKYSNNFGAIYQDFNGNPYFQFPTIYTHDPDLVMTSRSREREKYRTTPTWNRYNVDYDRTRELNMFDEVCQKLFQTALSWLREKNEKKLFLVRNAGLETKLSFFRFPSRLRSLRPFHDFDCEPNPFVG